MQDIRGTDTQRKMSWIPIVRIWVPLEGFVLNDHFQSKISVEYL